MYCKKIHDPVAFDDNFDEKHRTIINNYFGSTQVKRAINYAIYLSSIGMDCQFEKYDGLEPQFNDEMIESMFDFYEEN